MGTYSEVPRPFPIQFAPMRGDGSGIEGTPNDGYHFLYQPCISNVELTAGIFKAKIPATMVQSAEQSSAKHWIHRPVTLWLRI